MSGKDPYVFLDRLKGELSKIKDKIVSLLHILFLLNMSIVSAFLIYVVQTSLEWIPQSVKVGILVVFLSANILQSILLWFFIKRWLDELLSWSTKQVFESIEVV